MQAITVRDRDAGVGGLSLTDVPYPQAAQNDVIVRVYAAGLTPSSWTGRQRGSTRRARPDAEHARPRAVGSRRRIGVRNHRPHRRPAGVRTGRLGPQRLAGRVRRVEARYLAALPADIDHTVAAALLISGLTAWQGLIEHARLTTGQTVLIHGAAGGVSSIAVQLARELGARVIGTGRAADRDTAIGLGVDGFLDLQADKLEDAGEVDVVLDMIGGEIRDSSTALVRPGGTLVSTVGVPTVQPKNGRAIFFVVEADRSQLAGLAQRLTDGRLKPIVGAIRALAEAPAAVAPDRHTPGKAIIRITEDG
jgi:NADPH:quinone reductase-like Zn-dependent oxidoreductase